MPVDPSIPLGIHTPVAPISPLQIMDARNQLRFQQLAQQEQQARTQQIALGNTDSQLKLAAAARMQAGIEARAAAIKDTMKPDGTPDYQAASDKIAADFPEIATDLMDAATKTADSRARLSDMLNKLQNEGVEHRGELALNLQRALKTSPNPHETLANYLTLAAGDKVIPEDQARQLMSSAQALPSDASGPSISQWADQFITPTIRGREATTAKAEADAEKAAAEAENIKKFGTSTPPSLQSENVTYNGKPVQATFNPITGRRSIVDPQSGQTVDVTGKTTPIPPASMQINQNLVPSGDALSMAARRYLTTGELPSMGMGQAGAAARVAVMNEAAKLDPTAGLAQNAATFKADSANLTNLQKTEGTLAAFESTAGKNLDQFLSAYQKLSDTGSPLLNRPIRTLQGTALGDPNVAAANAAAAVALREIARVTNDPKLSGSLTDSARQEVSSLVPAGATLQQLASVTKVLRSDMSNMHSSLKDQIAAVKSGIGSNPAKDTTTPTTGAFIEAKDPQGNIHHAPAGTPLPKDWTLVTK